MIGEGRLICIVGAGEIRDRFMDGLIGEWERIGYEIFRFHLTEMQKSLGALAPFVKGHVKAVVTFDDQGLSTELIPQKNLWEQLNIPVIDLLTDHPAQHLQALDHAPAGTIVICSNREQMEYLKKTAPNVGSVGCFTDNKDSKTQEKKRETDLWQSRARELDQDLLADL